jgi:hypothetical protein
MEVQEAQMASMELKRDQRQSQELDRLMKQARTLDHKIDAMAKAQELSDTIMSFDGQRQLALARDHVQLATLLIEDLYRKVASGKEGEGDE